MSAANYRAVLPRVVEIGEHGSTPYRARVAAVGTNTKTLAWRRSLRGSKPRTNLGYRHAHSPRLPTLHIHIAAMAFQRAEKMLRLRYGVVRQVLGKN